jgi:hypothetical protein
MLGLLIAVVLFPWLWSYVGYAELSLVAEGGQGMQIACAAGEFVVFKFDPSPDRDVFKNWEFSHQWAWSSYGAVMRRDLTHNGGGVWRRLGFFKFSEQARGPDPKIFRIEAPLWCLPAPVIVIIISWRFWRWCRS